jgi:hypothetical protein
MRRALGTAQGSTLLASFNRILIGAQQTGNLATGQRQLQKIIHRMIDMASESHGFSMQRAIGFDVINLIRGAAETMLQTIQFILSCALHVTDKNGPYGEHWFWHRHKMSVKHCVMQVSGQR